jgi:type I restriction-modification system DNA methylase subunit
MDNFQHIAGFIGSVADDVLRDDFRHSKYPGVILPFTVLCRIDCVLAPTRGIVLKKCNELTDGIGAGIRKSEAEFLTMAKEMTG